MPETLIKSGTIVDGTGRPRFEGHVLVSDGKITDIIKNGNPVPEADDIVDAEGFVVSPGFIDVHSHAEWIVAEDRNRSLLNSYAEQGITTVISGNCGIAPAPVNRFSGEMIGRFSGLFTEKPLLCTWETFGDFLEYVQRKRPLLNFAQLTGHSVLRYHTGRTDHQRMDKEEMTRCVDGLKRSFDEGACGLSFGLGYYPGMMAPEDEIELLFKTAADHDKPVTVHTKSLSRFSPAYPLFKGFKTPHFAIALNEVIDIAEKTEAKLQISHFMLCGRRSWGSVDQCLSIVEEARKRGVDVMFDTIPYTCASTLILALVPMWLIPELPEGLQKKSAQLRMRLENYIGFSMMGFSYGDAQLLQSPNKDLAYLQGLNITEIGEKWGVSAFKALLMLCEKTDGLALMLYHLSNGDNGYEDPLDKIIANDLSLYGTDGLLKKDSWANPAVTGTFPKIIGHYARDRKFFALETAVKRITKDSAERFGLVDRGTLEPGKAADMVIFDYNKIRDNPGDRKRQSGKPEGVVHVFINGKQVVVNGSVANDVGSGLVL